MGVIEIGAIPKSDYPQSSAKEGANLMNSIIVEIQLKKNKR